MTNYFMKAYDIPPFFIVDRNANMYLTQILILLKIVGNFKFSSHQIL